jgi:repressor LexA
MAHSLTLRQKQILDYLRTQQRETGITPSTREVQKHFGFASQTAVMSHLKALERKGVIHRLPGKARAIMMMAHPNIKTELGDTSLPKEMRVLGPANGEGGLAHGLDRSQLRPLGERDGLREIPLYGQIAAGMASNVEQDPDVCIVVDESTLQLPRNNRTFALRVRGESMVDAHIMDGDIVILEFREPRHNDVVAALIDGETTLKRYKTENGRPFLKAENARFPNLIPAQELVIQGVVVALMRTYKHGV